MLFSERKQNKTKIRAFGKTCIIFSGFEVFSLILTFKIIRDFFEVVCPSECAAWDCAEQLFWVRCLSWREITLSLGTWRIYMHGRLHLVFGGGFCYEGLTTALILLSPWICVLKVVIWRHVIFTQLQFSPVLFTFVNISET